MRLSRLARKILLGLLKLDKPATKKELARLIEGEKAFYPLSSWAREALAGSRDVTYSRTIKGLIKDGYIMMVGKTGPWHLYALTNLGKKKAQELRKEIVDYIQEWSQLV